jgi:hypothetical protein
MCLTSLFEAKNPNDFKGQAFRLSAVRLSLEIIGFFAPINPINIRGLLSQAREFIGFVEVLYEGQGILPAGQVWHQIALDALACRSGMSGARGE